MKLGTFSNENGNKKKYNKEQPKNQTHKKRTRKIKKTKDKNSFFWKTK